MLNERFNSLFFLRLQKYLEREKAVQNEKGVLVCFQLVTVFSEGNVTSCWDFIERIMLRQPFKLRCSR